ncbi:hypothetical protein GC209_05360 [bacterium]|nr:hypothetical protein [bacterium]
MLRLSICSAALLSCLTAPVLADEVSDALQAAQTAYSAGDMGKASEQITMAVQAISAQQSARLTALLPPAPDGWTREDTADFTKSFGMIGGGSGAEATYSSADGATSFKLSFVADNPMVGSMGAMLGNAQMMAMMGKVVKVGNQALLSQDGSISALVNSRVLFQAQGGTEEQMLPLVQKIDFAKVGVFDTK